MKLKKYQRHNKPLKPSMIPRDYLERVCYGNEEIIECIYYITEDCPNECSMSNKISQGISHSAKTGLEKFIDRYGNDWQMIADGRG